MAQHDATTNRDAVMLLLIILTLLNWFPVQGLLDRAMCEGCLSEALMAKGPQAGGNISAIEVIYHEMGKL